MTTPNNNASGTQFPFVKLMFTDNVIPTGGKEDTSIFWQVGEAHPRAPNLRVRRMFVDRGGAEIYSSSEDNKVCVRDLIPTGHIQVVQEVMSIENFIEELREAEFVDAPVGPLSASDEDNDDETNPEEPEPDLDEPGAPALANDQITS